jgi:quercetin dioxygenase-like cupin family protein
MTEPGAAAPPPAARVLCDTGALLGEPVERDGVLWKIAEEQRQLDANLVRLAPGAHVPGHAEPDLDVLLLVVEGAGTLETPQGDQPLAAGSLAWLAHGSTRALRAGRCGMAYLTVHRRRPGMQVRPAPPTPTPAPPTTPSGN